MKKDYRKTIPPKLSMTAAHCQLKKRPSNKVVKLLLLIMVIFFSIHVYGQENYGFRIDRKKYSRFKNYAAFGAGLSQKDSFYPIEKVAEELVVSMRAGIRYGELEMSIYSTGEESGEEETPQLDITAKINLLAPFAEDLPKLCNIIHPSIGIGVSTGNQIYKDDEPLNAVGIFASGLELTLPFLKSGIYVRGVYKTPIVKRKDSPDIREGTYRRMDFDIGYKVLF